MRTAAAALLLVLFGTGCTPDAPEHATVLAEDGFVRLSLDGLTRDRVLFRTFKHDGRNVNFLVRRDGTGAVHVHLDACYACWRYRRGFVVEDDDVVCIACRLAYPLDDATWDFIGACAPIPIVFTVEGDEVVLQRSVLERAARYF